jgi:choline-sulfatase
MSSQPNILLLFSDEHSHRFLGSCLKNAEDIHTPNLDKLAANGSVFTDAYCQMPLCTPSRISMLTGKQVRKSGAWGNSRVIRPELNTMPRHFAAAGYETCLVGKMHLGGRLQMSGFQHRPYGDLTGCCGHQWEPIHDIGSARGMRTRTTHTGETGIPESLIQDQVVATETVTWIREQNAAAADQPWFVCSGFSRPHFPLTAPKRWIEYYRKRGISEPMFEKEGDAVGHPMTEGMRDGFRCEEIDHEEMMEARLGYFACVSYLDEVIGDMLANLERDGLLENTIIIYTTDHGEMAGEHGLWWKNGWFEACTRVPLIISTPEMRFNGEAASCSTPVALLDLFPTLCAQSGLDTPDDLDGRDLSPAINGETIPDIPIFCDALTPRWGKGTEFRSVRYQNYKYVRFRDVDPLFFNLEQDPGETVNLLSQGVPTEAADALKLMRDFAETSMDFDKAEDELENRDGNLSHEYKLELDIELNKTKGVFWNSYILPDGRMVCADEIIYDPTVLLNNAKDVLD